MGDTGSANRDRGSAALSEFNSRDSTPVEDAAQSKMAQVLYHIGRIFLGLIFVTAAIQKIMITWDFGRAILAYEILPGYLISPMGIVMPWVELAAGLFLLLNRMVRPSAILIALMNVMFILAIASVMIRGMDIQCGCAFEIGPMATIVGTQADGWALVRDFIFLGMAAYIYLNYRPKSLKQNDSGIRSALSPPHESSSGGD